MPKKNVSLFNKTFYLFILQRAYDPRPKATDNEEEEIEDNSQSLDDLMAQMKSL